MAGFFPESPTLLVWDTKAHRLLCELTTPMMLIVVESLDQLICHMARFLMQFTGHNIARESSRRCHCHLRGYQYDSSWTLCQDRSNTEYALFVAIHVVNLCGDAPSEILFQFSTSGNEDLHHLKAPIPSFLCCVPGCVVLHLSFGQHLLESGLSLAV